MLSRFLWYGGYFALKICHSFLGEYRIYIFDLQHGCSDGNSSEMLGGGGALQRSDVTYFVLLQARPFDDNHHDCHFCVYSLKSIVNYHQCEALAGKIMIFQPNITYPWGSTCPLLGLFLGPVTMVTWIPHLYTAPLYARCRSSVVAFWQCPRWFIDDWPGKPGSRAGLIDVISVKGLLNLLLTLQFWVCIFDLETTR